MSDLPSDEKLIEALEEILPNSDLSQLTPKSLRVLLEKRFECSLKSKKTWIKEKTETIVERLQEQAAKPGKKQKKKTAGVKRQADGEPKVSGFNKLMMVRPALREVLGLAEEQVSRPQLSKAIWVYIKAHNLQDEDNKRQLVMDKALQKVFQRDSFNMFQMNRYLGAHLMDPASLNLDEPLEPQFPPRYVEDPSEEELEERKSKKAKIAAAKKAKSPGKQAKPKRVMNPNSGLNRPLILSEALGKLLNETQLSRPQAVKAIWVYIKAHNLQDENDKRTILCDPAMKGVFGVDKMGMFEMTKMLSAHFLGNAEIPEGDQQQQQQKAAKDEVEEEQEEPEEEDEEEDEEDDDSDSD